MSGFVMVARQLSIWFHITINRFQHYFSSYNEASNRTSHLEQFIESHHWQELEDVYKEPCETSITSANITSWRDYLHHYYDRDWKEAYKKDQFQLNNPNTIYYKFDDEGNCITLKGNGYAVVVEELNALFNTSSDHKNERDPHHDKRSIHIKNEVPLLKKGDEKEASKPTR